ncbi:MAG: DUF1631 family protein [Arenimonas sp.]
MKTAVVPLPTTPEALLAKLRVSVPTAVVPAFEQALLMVQTQLNQLSEALVQAGEPDKYGADGQALYVGIRAAVRDFRAKLIEAADAMLAEAGGTKKQKFNLSLIEHEEMQVQLVCERLVERLTYLQRKGLVALDQRLCKILDITGTLGPRLPLSPQVFADAAKDALAEMTLSDEFKAQIIQHFDLLLDPVLSDLLKEYNAGLAASGVLPNLMIQGEEERIRRQSIKVPALIAPAESASTSSTVGENSGAIGNAQTEAGSGAQYNRNVDEKDRALFMGLLEQMKSMQAQGMQMNFGPGAGTGSAGGTGGNMIGGSTGVNMGGGGAYSANTQAQPQRAIAKSETLAMLDKLQHGSGNTNAVLEAIGKPDGSIAETIKRELLQNAKQTGVTKGDEQGTLEPADETAVQLAGNLFEVMLKDRPYGDAVAPVLAQMVMPFVRAAVTDPQLFLERHHPARELLNTVSEACEDNLGETPQEREMLSQVESAVQRISQEYDGDISKFQSVQAELNSQMQVHRRRAQMSEKRASEAQQGQERLEIARSQATTVVNNIVRQYALPSALRHFFRTEWMHHLSVTALRKGKDSEAFTNAARIAQPWIDLLDMASLGEPLPLSHLDTLEVSTQEVLASSGVHDDAAMDYYQTLINSVSEWTEEIVTTEDTSETNSETNSQTSPPLVPATSPHAATGDVIPSQQNNISEPDTISDGSATIPVAENAVGDSEEPLHNLRPTEEELAEVTSYTLGCWLQLPKAGGGFQQLKVAWISGISGSVMLVNRRGARVMVLSPPELVALKRRNELLLFQDESPVDQAMTQLLEKLKRK